MYSVHIEVHMVHGRSCDRMRIKETCTMYSVQIEVHMEGAVIG